jgi:DNA polymerase-1
MWNINIPPSEYYDVMVDGRTTSPIEQLIQALQDAKEIAIDTETTGLVSWKDIPLYFSVAWDNRRATVHARALPLLNVVFRDPSKRWIFANAKYDMHILANVGITFAGSIADVQVMHALLYEDRPHDLKGIVSHILGWRWSDFQGTFGKIGKKQSAEQLIRKAEAENFDLLVEYAANDAWGTLEVYRALKRQLEAAHTDSLFVSIPPHITTLWDLFDKTEVPYTKVLWTCERNGILINEQYLQQIAPTATSEIDNLSRDIVRLSGGLIMNPNSPAQLLNYLQSVGAPLTKMTKGGKTGIRKISVDEEVLKALSDEYEVADKLLTLREYSKLKGTYIDGLAEVMDPNGRIHTRYNQDIARTGRLSSSGPNLQNIPRPDNDKWKLRGAFIAPPKHKLIVADYEQLEMRLLADGSREEGMCEVIRRGWDIHMGNASMIYGVPYDDIALAKKVEKKVKNGELPESEMTDYVKKCLTYRAEVKTIGFGLVYGMGDNKLARDLGITKMEATAKSKHFMEKYPAVKSFKEEMLRDARDYGCVFTIMGRRRNLPSIHSYNSGDRSQAERIAVNTPIQGSAADVVRMAQLLCWQASLDRRYGALMLLQVHDELVFQCPDETVDECKAEIKEYMQHPFVTDLSVPLGVDINHGQSWMAAK